MDPGAEAAIREACTATVQEYFPDMCPDHLEQVALERGWDAELVIAWFLDQQESGAPYPKRPRGLKRKREEDVDSDDEGEDGVVAKAVNKYLNVEREECGQDGYNRMSKFLLGQDFRHIPLRDIEKIFSQNNFNLFQTYRELDRLTNASRSGQQVAPWRGLKKLRKAEGAYDEKQLPQTADAWEFNDSSAEHAHKAVIEMGVARKVIPLLKGLLPKSQRKELKEQAREFQEKENAKEQKNLGNVAECGCCFDDAPLNRMIYCDGDVPHAFCVDCARRQAETAIGIGKFELSCMSTDGCTAGFCEGERKKFLTEKLIGVLNRLEAAAALRIAGIEDLTSCPFCDFAAECAPVEVDKEFRCQNAECKIVSCRLCRRETHVPKSCEEVTHEDEGLSARRQIEEAMSTALIRKCNKCKTPFIKENGCNKMTCTAAGCRNVQCYVCSKSCDYSHFDDKSRGGKEGNCPLFDSVEQRHENEVTAAEKEARKKVAGENPNISDEYLKFKMSTRVQEDEKRRKDKERPRMPLEHHHHQHHQHYRMPERVPPRPPAPAPPPAPPPAAAPVPPALYPVMPFYPAALPPPNGVNPADLDPAPPAMPQLAPMQWLGPWMAPFVPAGAAGGLQDYGVPPEFLDADGVDLALQQLYGDNNGFDYNDPVLQQAYERARALIDMPELPPGALVPAPAQDGGAAAIEGRQEHDLVAAAHQGNQKRPASPGDAHGRLPYAELFEAARPAAEQPQQNLQAQVQQGERRDQQPQAADREEGGQRAHGPHGSNMLRRERVLSRRRDRELGGRKEREERQQVKAKQQQPENPALAAPGEEEVAAIIRRATALRRSQNPQEQLHNLHELLQYPLERFEPVQHQLPRRGAHEPGRGAPAAQRAPREPEDHQHQQHQQQQQQHAELNIRMRQAWEERRRRRAEEQVAQRNEERRRAEERRDQLQARAAAGEFN